MTSTLIPRTIVGQVQERRRGVARCGRNVWDPANPDQGNTGTLNQNRGYMAQCGAEEGHLVVFDRRTGKRRRAGGEAGGTGSPRPEGEKARSERRQDGCKVTVWKL